MKKTKIVCTLGPSSDNVEILKKIITSGMNVARLNFAHGSFVDYKRQMKNIREASAFLNIPIAILIDIKGPEIRIGKLASASYSLLKDELLILTTEQVVGTKERVSVNHPNFIEDVYVGAKVLIDDGSIELVVEHLSATDATCRILNHATLKPNKGVNLPGVQVSLPGVTERDIEHIHFGVDNDIDFIAASFVRKAADILEIRALLKTLNAEHIQIISKIENQEGIDNFDAILEASDGIMVARGDLGVEIPMEDVPNAQKMMIRKCNEKGKPVITATQMLDSMQTNPRPTRAEVSDVANAILDGTDAIMLSGETAAGAYPLESVQMMVKIAETTEKSMDFIGISSHHFDATEAIAQASITAAEDVHAKAIITPTETGHTPRLVAKYKPKMPIIAVTTNDTTSRMLSLVSGVTPIKGHATSSLEELFDMSIQAGINEGMLQKGDTIILTGGYSLNEPGTTNLLKIDKI